MMVMVGDRPLFACDQCYAPVAHGIVVYSVECVRGHLPAPQIACSERCAQRAERQLTVQPTKRMDWITFLDGLTQP
jgi:hypothetical protein